MRRVAHHARPWGPVCRRVWPGRGFDDRPGIYTLDLKGVRGQRTPTQPILHRDKQRDCR